MRSSIPAVLACLLALAAGCSSPGDEDTQPSPAAAVTSPSPATAPSRTASTATPRPSPSRSASASPRPSPTPSPARPLDDEWYVDTNDDAVPDFVEAELGSDPTIDVCATSANCPGPAGGAAVDLVSRTQNTLLVLDASGSMGGTAGGGVTKMDAARAALGRYVTGTPELMRLGFLVYGHRGSNDEADKAVSCAGIELLAPLGGVDPATFDQVLAGFQPTGFTPIAGALDAAGPAFAGQEGAANRVILVSDGIETCDGDPVAAAQRLKTAGIAVTVDVVGFDVDAAAAAQLRQVAEVTGGTYTDAATADALAEYFEGERARIAGLLDQLGCVHAAANTVFGCYLERLNSVEAWFRQHLIDHPEYGRAQRHAIESLLQEARAIAEHRRTSTAALDDARMADLRRQLQEAADRMQARYGEDVSAATPCLTRAVV